jgi:hypothetical protein
MVAAPLQLARMRWLMAAGWRALPRARTAGLDPSEFVRKQHDEPSRMANSTGDPTRFITGTPVDVRTRRSDDRGPRVLRNHQPAEW